MLPSTRWRSQPTVSVRKPLKSVEVSLVLSPARPNLLLEGPESQLEAAVSDLTPFLSRPLLTWRGGIGSALPAERRGTLIVQKVNRLNGDQQRQLMRWLDDRLGTVQVIAMTSERLFPLVERGAFLDALYYRLNTVRVKVPA